MAGHVLNPLGRVPPDAELSAVLVFRDRRGRAPAARVGADVEHRGDRLAWRAEFDPQRRVRPIGFVDPLWDVRLRVTVNGETMVTRPGTGTGSPPLNDVDLPVRPRLSRLAGDVLRSHVTASGHLSFVLDARGRGARLTGAACAGAAGTRAGRGSWRRARRLHRSARGALASRRTKTAVFNRVLTRLPVRPGLAVFESHLGRSYSDNPKYIYRELRRSGRAVDAVWSYRTSPEGFPADARLVRRGSWAYYRALARARYWVDNQGFPDGLRKRPETTYVQTWHGSAVKPMGLDQPRLKAAPAAERRGSAGWWTATTASWCAPTTTSAPSARPSACARRCCRPGIPATIRWSPGRTATPSWPPRSPRCAARSAWTGTGAACCCTRRRSRPAPAAVPSGRSNRRSTRTCSRANWETSSCCCCVRTTCAGRTSRRPRGPSCATRAACRTSPRCCCSRTR
nr:CDP-glycerol glycerophosphotransferase family protein [Actinomadura sp. CNU-125]